MQCLERFKQKLSKQIEILAEQAALSDSIAHSLVEPLLVVGSTASSPTSTRPAAS